MYTVKSQLKVSIHTKEMVKPFLEDAKILLKDVNQIVAMKMGNRAIIAGMTIISFTTMLVTLTVQERKDVDHVNKVIFSVMDVIVAQQSVDVKIVEMAI